MENFIIIFCAYIFLVAGCVGAILPVLPGPLLSYGGLLIIHFLKFDGDLLTQDWLIFYTVITIIVFLLDYLLQFFGVKKFGGGKKAVYGTTIGLLLGLFFLLGGMSETLNRVEPSIPFMCIFHEQYLCARALESYVYPI